jgi:hypothetical protein
MDSNKDLTNKRKFRKKRVEILTKDVDSDEPNKEEEPFYRPVP